MPRAPWLLGIVLGLVGCDHATKRVAAGPLRARGAPLEIVPGVLDLRYTENHDTAFSLTRALHAPWKPVALLGFAGIGTALVLAAALRRGAHPAERAGWCLVLAGALGNVADRATRGFVVDFVHLAWWPVFNVADVAVVAGAVAVGVVRARGRPSR